MTFLNFLLAIFYEKKPRAGTELLEHCLFVLLLFSNPLVIVAGNVGPVCLSQESRQKRRALRRLQRVQSRRLHGNDAADAPAGHAQLSALQGLSQDLSRRGRPQGASLSPPESDLRQVSQEIWQPGRLEAAHEDGARRRALYLPRVRPAVVQLQHFTQPHGVPARDYAAADGPQGPGGAACAAPLLHLSPVRQTGEE